MPVVPQPIQPQTPSAPVPRWRDRIDWPALAILVLPLALMALIETSRVAPSPGVARSATWHGDLSREGMPVLPDSTSRSALVSRQEPPAPWQGDLAMEAMPLVPDPANRAAHVPPEHLPQPWHGDVTREAMPLLPDPAQRVAFAPPLPTSAPWRGDLAREPMPLQPDPASRLGMPTIAAGPPPMCIPREEAAQSASTVPPGSFGRAIAAAARAQTDSFVIYNARYVRMSYPRGDTHPLYGVCTDVVIRAYRALDIDLQELIHTSRLGRGDASIDHRRVEIVRRFLARHGTSLAISEFAEDYRPGDIVTYHRPEGRISQHHIAIVTDQIAPSGRPLIVHNRGWGPQIEDALFVDRITGHYRLSGTQVEAFQRTRAPRVSERRRRTADISSTTRR